MNQSTCKGLHHTALHVSDLADCIRFYEAMGMSLLRSWGEGAEAGAMLDMGDGIKVPIRAVRTEEQAGFSGIDTIEALNKALIRADKWKSK